MKQQQFEAEHVLLWQEVDAILQNQVGNRASTLPQLYRRLCQSLALALQRGYSPALCDHLQARVHGCHQLMYGSHVARPLTLQRWILVEFPRTVRDEWQLLLVAIVAVWGVALACGLLVWWRPEWAYSFIAPYQLESYHAMYRETNFNQGRGSDGSDVAMFGLYIWNNVSICFRTFAGGIMGGIPALISMAFNGMHMGVIAAWLSLDPVSRANFWSFVITHSSFEITGLLLSGQAGLRLGLALLRPQRLSRRHALYAASKKMFPVMTGAALMTALAAFFEGFWSASSASNEAKYIVGALCWALVIGFFSFAGRGKN